MGTFVQSQMRQGQEPCMLMMPWTARSESAWEEQTSVLMKGTMQGTSWPRQMPLDGALIMAMTFRQGSPKKRPRRI